MAVGIGRAVVQGEGRAARLFAQAVIDADLLPAGQPVGFALRQARAHREIGFGQEHGVAVVNRDCAGRSAISAVLWIVEDRGATHQSRRLKCQVAGPIIREGGADMRLMRPYRKGRAGGKGTCGKLSRCDGGVQA